MVIKKINLKEVFPITLNIEDSKLNPHIADAEKYDLLPYIGQTLLTALRLVSDDYSTWEGEWNGTDNYTTGQKVIHGNQVWEAAQNNTNQEPSSSNTANWTLLELESFWYAHVKIYVAFNALSRYSVYAGKNFTQFGVVKPFEPTSQPADPREVAAIIKDLENKMNIEFTLMSNALEDANWEFDGTTYTQPVEAPSPKRMKKFGINAID